MSHVSNPFTAAATWNEKKQINKRQDVDYKQTLEICDCEIMDSSGVEKGAFNLPNKIIVDKHQPF